MIDLRRLERHARRVDLGFLRPGSELWLGRHRSVFRGQGVTFAESREYQFGDDIRHLDWNVTARCGRPFVKIYEQERGTTVLIVLDLSASLRTGSGSKIELVRELGVLFSLWAQRGHERLGVVLCTDRIERVFGPRRGATHVQSAIRAILTSSPTSVGTGLSGALRVAARLLKKPGIVIVISDFLDGAYEPSLRSLSRHHDVLGIAVTDPAEASLPGAGLVRYRDAETGASRWVDTSHPGVRATYRIRWEAIQERRDRIFAGAAAPLIELHVGTPYLPRLARLAHRGIRG